MKNWKKTLAVAAAGAMVLSQAACGAGGQSSSDSGSASGGGASGTAASSTASSASGDTLLSKKVVPNYIGTLDPSFTARTDDSYTIGLYVDGNKVNKDYSYLGDYVDATKDAVNISDLSIKAEGSGFTALAVQGESGDAASNVNIDNVDLEATDDEDGTNASDFTGLGAAILTYGNDENNQSTVNIKNSNIKTKGFERDGIIVEDYSDVIMEDSTLDVEGANPLPGKDAYDGYLSSANQSYMLSPPWILGIVGGARAANVLGTDSSLSVVNSDVTAGGWAVLSTDACTRPVINVINSTLAIQPSATSGINGGSELYGYDTDYGSGYGTYAIGGAKEYFYGTTFNNETYATIFTGSGEVYYGASKDGLKVQNGTGKDIYTYSGEGQDTVVNTIFGIMDHQGADVTLGEGSEWNTEEATILRKANGMGTTSTYTIDGAKLNPKSGIIFQAMDNDDGYGTSATEGNTKGKTYDGAEFGMPTFSGGWYDPVGKAGLPSDNDVMATGGTIGDTLNIESDDYAGDIYNGLGSGKDLDGVGLAINLSNTTLKGAISSTETVHGLPYSESAVEYLDKLADTYGNGVALQGGTGGASGDGTYTVKYALLDKDGKVTTNKDDAAYIQMLEYTINEYYMQGHVINFPAEGSTMEVQLSDNSTWNVDKDSYITYLDIEDGSSVEIADGATLYIGGKAYTGTLEAGTYGEKVAAPEESAAGGMGGGPGGRSASGDASGEAPQIDTSHPVQLTVTKK